MARAGLGAMLLVALAAGAALGQSGQKYSDPDSAATNAAAKAALAQAKILDIVGVSSGIKGVLEDLGAKVTDQEIRIELEADVLFDFDKYTLKPEATAALGKVGQVAAAYPDYPMFIEGHTDGKGTHAYNMKLSDNRANAVKEWLVKNGSVAASRITTQGFGETKPVAPNKNPDGSDNPEGRQKNRRVEIVLRKK